MLGRLLGSGDENRTGMSYQQLWMNDQWSGGNTWAGTPITQTTALQIDTVYACIRLYADTISTLPIAAFRRENGERRPWGPRPVWMDDVGVWGLSWSDYVQQGLVSLLLDGNWFTKVYRRATSSDEGPAGSVIGLHVLDPTRVQVEANGAGDVVYLWDGQRIDGDVLHLTELRLPGQLRGVSRIDELKQTLGLTRALDEFSSRFFSNNAAVSGVIEAPAVVTAPQAKEILDSWETAHKGLKKSNRPGFLGGGATFKKISVDPDEAQMLQSKQFAVESVARVFRVPLHKLQVATPGAMSYASVEANDLAWGKDSLRPYIDKIERAHTTLLPQGVFARINMDAVHRADIATRSASYSTGLQSGYYSLNDVRRLEDLPAIEGGDVPRVPLTNVDLPAANVVETEKNVAMAVELINAGADPAETLEAFGLPSITFTEPPAVKPTPVRVVTDPEPKALAPVRHIRSVERDAHGNIARIIDTPEES